MCSRSVINLDLTQAKPPITCQHRNEAVALAIDHNLIQHFTPYAFESAVEIVQADPGKHSGHHIVNLRRYSFGQSVATTMAPAANEVVTLVQLIEKQRQ